MTLLQGVGRCLSSSGVCLSPQHLLFLEAVLFFEIEISSVVPRFSLRNLVSVDRTSTPEDTEGAIRSGVQKGLWNSVRNTGRTGFKRARVE